jgi:hypothetical protein
MLHCSALDCQTPRIHSQPGSMTAALQGSCCHFAQCTDS